jgi:hypothetical protein
MPEGLVGRGERASRAAGSTWEGRAGRVEPRVAAPAHIACISWVDGNSLNYPLAGPRMIPTLPSFGAWGRSIWICSAGPSVGATTSHGSHDLEA